MDIALKSLASAIATAIILIIAKFFGPKMAGAIGGISCFLACPAMAGYPVPVICLI